MCHTCLTYATHFTRVNKMTFVNVHIIPKILLVADNFTEIENRREIYLGKDLGSGCPDLEHDKSDRM